MLRHGVRWAGRSVGVSMAPRVPRAVPHRRPALRGIVIVSSGRTIARPSGRARVRVTGVLTGEQRTQGHDPRTCRPRRPTPARPRSARCETCAADTTAARRRFRPAASARTATAGSRQAACPRARSARRTRRVRPQARVVERARARRAARPAAAAAAGRRGRIAGHRSCRAAGPCAAIRCRTVARPGPARRRRRWPGSLRTSDSRFSRSFSSDAASWPDVTTLVPPTKTWPSSSRTKRGGAASATWPGSRGPPPRGARWPSARHRRGAERWPARPRAERPGRGSHRCPHRAAGCSGSIDPRFRGV